MGHKYVEFKRNQEGLRHGVGNRTRAKGRFNILQENGVSIIRVTSTSSSTLSNLADINIHISTRETVFRSGAMASRASSLYIVDMLYALYCSKDYHHASQMIEKTRIDSKNN